MGEVIIYTAYIFIAGGFSERLHSQFERNGDEQPLLKSILFGIIWPYVWWRNS
jgi:hypothetical protein